MQEIILYFMVKIIFRYFLFFIYCSKNDKQIFVKCNIMHLNLNLGNYNNYYSLNDIKYKMYVFYRICFIHLLYYAVLYNIIVVMKMDIFHCYLIRYYIICYKINNNKLAKKTVKFIIYNINKICIVIYIYIYLHKSTK